MQELQTCLIFKFVKNYCSKMSIMKCIYIYFFHMSNTCIHKSTCSTHPGKQQASVTSINDLSSLKVKLNLFIYSPSLKFSQF